MSELEKSAALKAGESGGSKDNAGTSTWVKEKAFAPKKTVPSKYGKPVGKTTSRPFPKKLPKIMSTKYTVKVVLTSHKVFFGEIEVPGSSDLATSTLDNLSTWVNTLNFIPLRNALTKTKVVGDILINRNIVSYISAPSKNASVV